MDADGQAIKALWCWVGDRFGARRARGLRSIPFRTAMACGRRTRVPGMASTLVAASWLKESRGNLQLSRRRFADSNWCC